MGATKRKRLETAVAAIQLRWGQKALQSGRAIQPPTLIPPISTSFPTLDQALDGINGIPRSRITEILGAPTSGMATLALKIIVQAQATGDTAAYLDLGATFDPDYAARCEVNLSRLLVVRPASAAAALEIAHSLIANRGIGVIVLATVAHLLADSHGLQTISAALRQLPSALASSPGALIFLTPLQFGDALSTANYPSGFALPAYATLRLELKKEKWLYRGQDVRGYQARVLVLKNKLGRAGHQATIAITFNGVVKGDST